MIMKKIEEEEERKGKGKIGDKKGHKLAYMKQKHVILLPVPFIYFFLL
jgi:hypothetical protein